MTSYTPIAGVMRMERVAVVAHRGASRVAPENTLPAFQVAVQWGVDMVEFDYLHTADQVPVAFHDEDLDRLTDARARWGGEKIPLATKTLAELKTLDAGSWLGPQFAGTRIPTLEEALDAILAGSLPLIERKAGDAATFVDLVNRRHCVASVAVMAFDWDYLRECRRLSPTLVLGALGEHDISAAQLDEMQSFGAAFAGWNNKHLTKAHVDALHERGLRASVWTVDDPGRAKELVSFGVDMITSNVPDVIKAAIAGLRKG
ncbi:MAG TPA: glycerophosphodiester phosphodiesterase family protein [Pirellulales bacterium]|nr:glycerophosphodiester phosphodiesterase family protein [Pirellulales bacterium]